MKLVLERLQLDSDVTIGSLTVDGDWECWTLEDTVRAPGVKVPAETAIPYGTYLVTVTWSLRFRQRMPLLHDVPMFTGVRIHSGNNKDHTEGCILVGVNRLGKSLGSSRIAYKPLLTKIDAAIARGETVTLGIVKGTTP